ncbi:hypothetical protein [Tropicibacter sp. Alg240-R139]|uniref:hypothetical protein n=1 Tax=Tropicibacter sp. Alg240-R139 TaxID=2305991 RepID=UPI0013DE8119|nr:hypothetical protein [Tropicibacter sp. Alg240-R139]
MSEVIGVLTQGFLKRVAFEHRFFAKTVSLSFVLAFLPVGTVQIQQAQLRPITLMSLHPFWNTAGTEPSRRGNGILEMRLIIGPHFMDSRATKIYLIQIVTHT